MNSPDPFVASFHGRSAKQRAAPLSDLCALRNFSIRRAARKAEPAEINANPEEKS
jgi:hypothetical protein